MIFADLIWILKVSRCDELLGAWIRIAADIFRIYEPWIQLPTEEDVRKFMLLHVIPDAADSQDTSKYRGSILGAICRCVFGRRLLVIPDLFADVCCGFTRNCGL